MFVRTKSTPNSPRKTVQIVENVREGDKVKQKIIRYVGVALNDFELKKLKELGEYIKEQIEEERSPRLFKPEELAKQTIESKKAQQQKKEITNVNIENLKEEQRNIYGIHEVYGKVYEEIGFNKVLKSPSRNKSSNKILKDIIMARIANPKSKRGSVIMLEENFGIGHNLDYVYRTMDKIDEDVIKKIQNTAYLHSKKLLREKIDLVLVDATTLYFESFTEDELRQCGFSKDHKFQETQVLLALMVTKAGLPIGYKLFPGSTYEGHALVPMLNEIRDTYDLDKVIFVADSGLFNEKNLNILEKNNFEYIVGARLKNLPKNITKEVLDIDSYSIISNENSREVLKVKRILKQSKPERYLVTSHSSLRARKDKKDREKNIEKLIKKIKGNKKVKDIMSNNGYKKYLQLDINEKIKINEQKTEEASKWDGFHGVITNAKKLSNQDILSYYHELWQVEESFRVSKHDCKVRPIFHWKPKRIKAHIAISFMVFTCIRSLEYRVKLQYKKLSPEVIRKELINVQGSLLVDQETKQKYFLPSKVTDHAKKIYKVMRLQLRETCFPIYDDLKLN